MNIYIYIHIYIFLTFTPYANIFVYIYIYIEREREITSLRNASRNIAPPQTPRRPSQTLSRSAPPRSPPAGEGNINIL